ncbi:MAG: hypothetical protein EOO12_00270 [Chitinophagaceae bacterium]|nr:MAG: hypothetical protein EOO12_00270 [Chitinophagaceae bacterium]
MLERDEPTLTLTRLEPTGDAEMFVLTDSAGYEHKFVVSGAQMATFGDSAVTDAIRRAVERYRQTNSPQ